MLSINQLQISAKPGGLQPLLGELTFTVGPGEAIAVLGPSGCGKTTLLRSVAGLIDPLGGGVTIDERSVKETGWPSFRSRVSLVPQRPVVWDESVRDNLFRPQSFRSSRHACLEQDAEALLVAVGLGGKLRANAAELSEGERQRICLVRTLLARPDYLLLDEPTSALDEASVLAVESLLERQMKQGEGMGVLMVTHDRDLADRFCSREIDLSEYLLHDRGAARA